MSLKSLNQSEVRKLRQRAKSDQAERQRNKKLRRDGEEAHNLSSNISVAASSRVWLEEELAKVAAFPPLRELLGTTGKHGPTRRA